MDYSSFIAQTLKLSSEIATSNFGKVKSTIKENDSNQVLTQTDLEIGKFIISKINENYPFYNIIDEESGVIDNQSEYTWVVDPIDGTSNFADGVPTYGIFIGLLKGAESISGGIALPEFDQILVAAKSKGAFVNNQRIQVTQETDLGKVLVAYGIDKDIKTQDKTREEVELIGEIILKIRNLRISNSAFDPAMVAEGKYGAYLNQRSRIWDNVAQHVVIEEAGGVVTDFFGKSIDYSNPLNRINQNFTHCIGAPAIHRQIQEIITDFERVAK